MQITLHIHVSENVGNPSTHIDQRLHERIKISNSFGNYSVKMSFRYCVLSSSDEIVYYSINVFDTARSGITDFTY